MNNLNTSYIVSRLILIVSILIAVILGVNTWDITFWPSDAKDFYLDFALQMMHIDHISEIHHVMDDQFVRWGHGKEIFFLFISFVQRCLSDFETLRPIIILNLACFSLSAILVFLIARKYWGQDAGVICWFSFTFCVWPYLYILMAKHLPLGLAFFLLSVFVLFFTQDSLWGRINFWLSGLLFGFSVFSSTPSMLYAPCLFAAFLYRIYELNIDREFDLFLWIKTFLIYGLLVFLGLMVTFLYVNLPDLAYNIKSYMTHVYISAHHNHFYYNQPYLQQWFPFQAIDVVRGGWLWIVRYFFLIMPVMLPVYGLCLTYLIFMGIIHKNRLFCMNTGICILISLAAPLMAEIAGVAQYAANYFPALIGIVFLIGYTFNVMKKNGIYLLRGRLKYVIFLIGFLHLGLNLSLFMDDVYPTRMCKAFLSRRINKDKTTRFFTYRKHPHVGRMLPYLNPEMTKGLRFSQMNSIAQIPAGSIFIPPSTGDSIFKAMTSEYNQFDDDLFLSALFERNKIEKYALYSYPTLASSRIWLHEEEILSYRRLILKHRFIEDNYPLTRLWVLDAQRLHDDLKNNMPLPEDLYLVQNKLLRIGAKRKVLMFEGYATIRPFPKSVNQVITQIHKVNDPQDSLVLYVYKVSPYETIWINAAENFYSLPLPAQEISRDKDGLAVFQFDTPLKLDKGRHLFMIYRTGEPDDDNYYRIHQARIAVR